MQNLFYKSVFYLKKNFISLVISAVVSFCITSFIYVNHFQFPLLSKKNLLINFLIFLIITILLEILIQALFNKAKLKINIRMIILMVILAFISGLLYLFRAFWHFCFQSALYPFSKLIRPLISSCKKRRVSLSKFPCRKVAYQFLI